MEEKYNVDMKRLYGALLSLKTEEDCEALLEDLCTIREIQDFCQRLAVAEMLDEGKNYLEITAETGVSTATICRVNKCLKYGMGGYRRVLDRMKGEKKG